MHKYIYIYCGEDFYQKLPLCCVSVVFLVSMCPLMALTLAHEVRVLQQLGRPVSGLRYGVAFNVGYWGHFAMDSNGFNMSFVYNLEQVEDSITMKSIIFKIHHRIHQTGFWAHAISQFVSNMWISWMMLSCSGLPPKWGCKRSWTTAVGSKTPHRRCPRRMAETWMITFLRSSSKKHWW